MDAFSSGELGHMQDTAEESMQDTCVIQRYSSGSSDSFGQTVETFTDSEPLACGFNPRGGREVPGSESAPILTDASVRLPIDTTVDRRDRVKITHRFAGELVSPPVFEILGEPRQGPSALQVDLRRVAL